MLAAGGRGGGRGGSVCCVGFTNSVACFLFFSLATLNSNTHNLNLLTVILPVSIFAEVENLRIAFRCLPLKIPFLCLEALSVSHTHCSLYEPLLNELGLATKTQEIKWRLL